MTDRPGEALIGPWRLDPGRSNVEFRVGHFWGLMNVTGHFDDYDGRLDLSAEPAVELTIDAASVQTGNRKRDRHLVSADFFDVENQPQVRFVSDSVVPRDDGFSVRGRLFARGRSIPLELEARVHRTGEELELEASTTAPHRELGMTWNQLGMIQPMSELRVNGYLIRAPTGSGRSPD
jgi:polyisoprenoid-binding protein YceI